MLLLVLLLLLLLLVLSAQVRYMGFQFACIKTFNMIAAVANVACKDACRTRNSALCTFR
jgi:hypothetical protein